MNDRWPVLSERALNRALLARQLLLDRPRLPIPRALERICGVQAQYAPSIYVGLWSRIGSLARDDVTRALRRRSAVQATLMRATIHVVSRRDFWPIALGLREPRREWWLRVATHRSDARAIAAAAERVRALLEDGPMERREIVRRLALDAATWNGVGLWLDLVRVPPSGTWERRRADLFALAEDWVGPPTSDPDEGLRLLVRRYLRGFGPASAKDVASFTGVPRARLGPVLDTMPLRRFRDERGVALVDVRRAPIPDPGTPTPVRFLPTWDATLLTHARRTQILPEPYRPLVFDTTTPHSVNTFLVDGRVAGTWIHDGSRVRVDPFDPLPRPARRSVEAEASGLAAFLG